MLDETPSRKAGGPLAVFVLAGPGGSVFGQTEIDRLSRGLKDSIARGDSISQAFVVGDGEGPTSVERLIPPLQACRQTGQPINLFLTAHGDVEGSEHRIQLGDSYGPTRELFEALKNTLGDDYPLSVFMTSCHGGAASGAAYEALPRGATFVALASGTDAVTGRDVKRLIAATESSAVDPKGDTWRNSETLLNLYLTTCLKNRIPPEITVAGEGRIELDSLLSHRLSKPFSAAAQQRVHDSLDELLGAPAVSKLMSQIEGTRDEFAIDAATYGPALAVALAARDL